VLRGRDETLSHRYPVAASLTSDGVLYCVQCPVGDQPRPLNREQVASCTLRDFAGVLSDDLLQGVTANVGTTVLSRSTT